jgi:uncharacterized delta-60 repeat protein
MNWIRCLRLGFFGVLFGVGCNGDKDAGGDECPVGSEGCPCTAGGACDAGLTCLSNTCVDAGDGDDGASDDGGTDGGTGGGTDDGGSGSGSTTSEDVLCPNGELDPGEECDDGNMIDGDGCNNDCIVSGSLLWSDIVNGEGDGLDEARGVAIDAEGGVVAAGCTTMSGGDLDIWIRSYDSEGTEKWTTTVDGPAGGDDEGWGAAIDADGNAFVSGNVHTVGDHPDLWLGRYWADGSEDWTLQWDGPAQWHDVGLDVDVDGDGRAVVTGYSYVSAGVEYDVVLRKYNTDAVPAWLIEHHLGPNDLGQGVDVRPDGELAIGGGTDVDGTLDGLIARFDANGNEVWTRTHDQSGGIDWVYGAALDDEGNVIAAGYVSDVGSDSDGWLTKYSPTGDPLWTVDMADAANEVFTDVGVDGNGNIVATGYYGAQGQGANIVVLKLDPDGNEMWRQSYAGDSQIAPDGNIAVAGFTHVAGEDYNIWVARYAP